MQKCCSSDMCNLITKLVFWRYMSHLITLVSCPNPQRFWSSRRDLGKAKELASHQCVAFTSTSSILRQWSTLLTCRRGKNDLTAFLGNEFIELAPSFMNVLITNIKGTTRSTNIDGDTVPLQIHKHCTTSLKHLTISLWIHKHCKICKHCTISLQICKHCTIPYLIH